MVRRRTRVSKQPSPHGNMTNGVAVVVPTSLLEEQYFASPKRKDCKVDLNICEQACEDKSQMCFKPKTSNQSKTKGERNASRTIGVPLATRSQTRTIENFFKAKTATNTEHMDKNDNDMSLRNEYENDTATDDLITSPPMPCSLHIVSKQSQSSDYIFEFSEDTNDGSNTDNTEISEEAITTVNQEASNDNFIEAEFTTQHHDSFNMYNTINNTNNIFLQEPVLTLNVDKTLNQASSIKINKTIEVEPVFSSPPSLGASALHGRFNQIVSLNANDKMISPSKHCSLTFESVTTSNTKGCFLLLPDVDNNSCDSGVVFTSSFDNGNKSNNNYMENNSNSIITISSCDEDNVNSPNQISRRRKPATPHRILCPSPTKTAPRTITHNGRVISPSSGRKKEQLLSPRKSPRHMSVVTSVASKTRRRLSTQTSPIQHTQKEKAPYKIETTKTVVQNGFKLKNEINEYIINNDEDVNNINDTKNIINEQNEDLTIASKLIIEQQSKILSDKILETYTTKEKIIENGTAVSCIIKNTQKQKFLPPLSSGIKSNKKNQIPQPLTSSANSGNRELTEFFPVRRSVRKTKTAVKEEMMRSLEQAVLEERADGLKIAHFEGKGRGVVAVRRFQRGEFVVEYIGDLITMTEAAEREKQYALDENAGCYMYYFKHKNQQYCIDATVDTGKLGRLVNHSRNGNLITKVVVVKQRPHLVLLAKDDILAGEELTYDYGDRSKESLLHHPWLAF